MKKVILKYVLFFSLATALLCGASCRKDFDFQPSSGNLEFSKDTVFLDTVFANISSSTYSLKVYNRSSEDIQIPTIRLENGLESNYRLNVDGASGKEFENVPLLAKDSLFIFIEVTTPLDEVNQNQFLYTDAIQFASTNATQKVELVTLIKDAIFLYPRELSDGTTETLLLGLDEQGNEIRIEGFFLEDDELIFTNEKPYVIYGYAAVPNERIASFQAGARVHFHKSSGILVSPNGSLQINGALSTDQELLENEVIFEGDRLEPEFATIPGQWGTIWFTPGSTENVINYLTIKNATIGLLVQGNGNFDSANLAITNSQIYNSLNANLRARTAKINAENLVLGGAGFVSALLGMGGDYNFNHTTIANYWQNGFRDTPGLIITNSEENAQNEIITSDLVNANFTNTIIDGNRRIELGLLKNDDALFQYNFNSCTIKFNDISNQFTENPLYDFENTLLFNSIFLNGELSFQNVSENNFSLMQNSIAIDNGNPQAAQLVPIDILGVSRANLPDIGVYEYTTEN
ncbi:choice-of-anchor Q domain-containing protein [uncultured Croceitalea sp.]|uniref:choice-of-anchor Q domain-containing protein n=1 Tax=uncultured Croceitalea sp. TaxID=1798908 RepID=UPI003305EFA0